MFSPKNKLARSRPFFKSRMCVDEMLGIQQLSGFSLVEILVSIAIIGIIAAMVMSAYGRMMLQGKQVATMANMRQIGSAINSYSADNDNRLPGPCSVGVFNFARANPLDVDLAHLGQYIGVYLEAKAYNPSSPSFLDGYYLVKSLTCPALSKDAQNDPYVANYCMMDLVSPNPTYMFGGGAGGVSMATAKGYSQQPKRLVSLSDTERRTAFLCTADQKVNSSGKLPRTGPFNGKRLWLFLDGSQMLSTNTTTWTR